MSQQINLFNPALQKQEPVFTANTMLTAVAVLLAGCVALSLYARQSVMALEASAQAGAEQLTAAKKRQAQALLEFAPRQKSAELAAELAAVQLQLKALHDIDVTLKGGAMGTVSGYAEYFKALARQSSGAVWLTGVSISGAGTQIGLQGRALQADAVPAYIGRLTTEPAMQGKTFGSLSMGRPQVKDDKGGQEATFIEFSLQAEGVKDPIAEAGK
ncbi:MAG: PilN domain-containing protein [Gammaproteobacteria bacterium]